MKTNRRSFLKGLGLLAVAPALIDFEPVAVTEVVETASADAYAAHAVAETPLFTQTLEGNYMWAQVGNVITDLKNNFIVTSADKENVTIELIRSSNKVQPVRINNADSLIYMSSAFTEQ